MELSGQLHAPSALSPVATEHGRDETIFTLTYRQYTHTNERVGHLPTEVPQNTPSKH